MAAAKRAGHGYRIAGAGDGRVDQARIGAHLHGLTGLGRFTDAGIHHHGNLDRIDDDLQHLPCGQPPVGADGGTQGHDGGGAGVFQLAGDNGVRIDIGQHHEALLDQRLRGPKGLMTVGQ